MRFHGAGAAIAAMAGFAAPLAAQDAAKAAPSVESYLCTFAGKCGGTADTAPITRDAPETKGFRLARPASDTEAKPAPAPTPAFVRARPYGAQPGRQSRVRTPSATGAAARGVGVTATAVANLESLGRRRADLMIEFDLNSARISDRGIASARIFAQSLLRPELAGKRFAIEGHTDMRGSKALNWSLSARRAQAVADFLASQGVDRSRLVTRGLGYSVPLPGHSAKDPANRRVEAELES